MLEHHNRHLSSELVKAIRVCLDQGTEAIVSLRKCTMSDTDFKKLMQAVGKSSYIRQLSLCEGIVSDRFRLELLTAAVHENKSLKAIFLHGSTVGGDGMELLLPALTRHPRLTSLDLSDCQISDQGLEHLCNLLPHRPGRPGLRELSLSGNPNISSRGWLHLGFALLGGSSLRGLYLDYNEIGESALTALLAALAVTNTLETLDLECVGATDSEAKILLQLLETHPLNLKSINLMENDISWDLLEAIQRHFSAPVTHSGTPTPKDLGSDDEHSLATSEPPINDRNIVGALDGTYNSRQYAESGEIMGTDDGNSVASSAKDLFSSREADNFLNTQNGTTSGRSSLVASESGSVTTIEVIAKDDAAEKADRVHQINGDHKAPSVNQLNVNDDPKTSSEEQKQGVQSDALLLTNWEGCQSRTSIYSEVSSNLDKPSQKETLADLINRSKTQSLSTNTANDNKDTLEPQNDSKTPCVSQEISAIKTEAVATVDHDGTIRNEDFSKLQKTDTDEQEHTRRNSVVTIQGDIEIEDFL